MAAAAPGAVRGQVHPACDRRGSEDSGSGAEWKALWRVLELAGVGKTESGRSSHRGDVGEGGPALERWSESQSVAGERRARERGRALAGGREMGGTHQRPMHRQVEIRVANLAFQLGSATCRLPDFSPTSFPPPPPLFQPSKHSLIDAERTSFALLSGASLLAFNL